MTPEEHYTFALEGGPELPAEGEDRIDRIERQQRNLAWRLADHHNTLALAGAVDLVREAKLLDKKRRELDRTVERVMEELRAVRAAQARHKTALGRQIRNETLALVERRLDTAFSWLLRRRKVT